MGGNLMYELMPGEKKYGRGENPNSWAHAKDNKGRPKFRDEWGEDSKTGSFSASPTAITGLDSLAKQAGYSGRSEFIQYIGMGLVPLLGKDIDYEAMLANLKNQGFKSLEDFIIAISNDEVEILKKTEDFD